MKKDERSGRTVAFSWSCLSWFIHFSKAKPCYRLEDLDSSLCAASAWLPDLPFNALVLAGSFFSSWRGEQALWRGAQSSFRQHGLLFQEVDGTLARSAGRTDVILSVLLQETPAGLTDAYTVTVEPFVTSVTTDHEPAVYRRRAHMNFKISYRND